MNLTLLKSCAALFSTYKTLLCCRRVQEDIFELRLDSQIFYINTQKGASRIFTLPDALHPKAYHAPLDALLQKRCQQAALIQACVDGDNRILILHGAQSSSYKKQEFFLHFELTGKHTNVILTDANYQILEALRHLNEDKSSRIIQPHIKLNPLPQPQKAPYHAHFDFTPITESSKEALLRCLEDLEKQHWQQKLQKLRQNAIEALEKQLARVQSRLDALPSPETIKQQKDTFAHFAQLILTQLDKIPPYAKEIRLADFDGKTLSIQIPKPSRHGWELAEFFFQESKKLGRKAAGIGQEKEHLQSKIRFIRQKIHLIQTTQNIRHIAILKPQKREKKSAEKIGETFFIQGYKISIGRNQLENQQLLEAARSHDIWLHIKNMPSAHMILHCGKNTPPLELIQQAANLLVDLNKSQKGVFEVDYTQRKFLKVQPHALVHYTKYKTLSCLKD